MYIEQDFVGPATLDLQANRRMKNRILKHWPRLTVVDNAGNDIEVFDRLLLYSGGAVQQSASHLKIYNILGVDVEELKAEEWKGLKDYYLYFKVTQGLEEDLLTADLERYTVTAMPFTTKSVETAAEMDRSDWRTITINYSPLYVDAASNVLSNSAIISAIRNNPQTLVYDAVNSDVMAAAALLDTNDALFEKVFTVQSTYLTRITSTVQTDSRNKTKVIKEATLTLQFRRKLVTDAVQDAALDVVVAYINAIGTATRSIDIHSKRLYRSVVPFTDDDIVFSQAIPGYWDTDGSPESGFNIVDGYLVGYKIAGLDKVPSKTFNTTIVGQIDSGYTKESVSGWKKLVTMVVTIIIIVVAVAFPPAGWGATAWAATILTVGSLAMLGLSMILAKRDPAWAAYIGKMATVLGYIATVVGIINIVAQMAKALAAEAVKEGAEKAAAEAAKKATEEGVKEAAKEGASEAIKELSFQESITVIKDLSFEELSNALWETMKSSFNTSTSMSMSNVLNWATKGFQIYTNYIKPPDEGIDDLQDDVDAQEEILEDLTSSGLKDKIDYTFSSPYYNIYDFNEYMQAIPYSMTQGKIDECFNKYYDGVTSKYTYRGYLG